jgi:hypothetical protein
VRVTSDNTSVGGVLIVIVSTGRPVRASISDRTLLTSTITGSAMLLEANIMVATVHVRSLTNFEGMTITFYFIGEWPILEWRVT